MMAQGPMPIVGHLAFRCIEPAVDREIILRFPAILPGRGESVMVGMRHDEPFANTIFANYGVKVQSSSSSAS